MKKTNKPSISKEIDTNKLSPYASLKNMQSWRLSPVSDAFLDKFCEDLISWSYQKDAFCITQFLRYYGIHEQVFYNWVSGHEQVKNAHWVAMTNIGDRREIGAITKQFDAGIIEKSLHMYSSVYASARNYDARLKREEQGARIEDLTNCVRDLVEQKWGEKNEANTGTDSEAREISAKAVSDSSC